MGIERCWEVRCICKALDITARAKKACHDYVGNLFLEFRQGILVALGYKIVFLDSLR